MPLNPEQVRSFREEGVLVAERILTDEALAPVIAEYDAWIACRARDLAAEGKLYDLYPDAGFERRAVPLKKGGIVFIHRYTPHRSTPNYTHGVRWSLDLRYQPTGTPTGRPFHPDFIVRSRAHPESELTDHAEWSRRWIEALEVSRGIQCHRV